MGAPGKTRAAVERKVRIERIRFAGVRGRATQRNAMQTGMSERSALILGGVQAFGESAFVGGTIQLSGMALGQALGNISRADLAIV